MTGDINQPVVLSYGMSHSPFKMSLTRGHPPGYILLKIPLSGVLIFVNPLQRVMSFFPFGLPVCMAVYSKSSL